MSSELVDELGHSSVLTMQSVLLQNFGVQRYCPEEEREHRNYLFGTKPATRASSAFKSLIELVDPVSPVGKELITPLLDLDLVDIHNSLRYRQLLKENSSHIAHTSALHLCLVDSFLERVEEPVIDPCMIAIARQRIIHELIVGASETQPLIDLVPLLREHHAHESGALPVYFVRLDALSCSITVHNELNWLLPKTSEEVLHVLANVHAEGVLACTDLVEWYVEGSARDFVDCRKAEH